MIYLTISAFNALLLYCIFERWYKLQMNSWCLLCTMFWLNMASTGVAFCFNFEWIWLVDPLIFVEYAVMPFVLTVITSAWYMMLKAVH